MLDHRTLSKWISEYLEKGTSPVFFHLRYIAVVIATNPLWGGHHSETVLLELKEFKNTLITQVLKIWDPEFSC